MSGWSMVLIMSRKLIVSSSTSILVFLWQSSALNGMSSVWTKPTSCLPDPRSHTLYKLCKSVWWHLPDTCFFMLYLSAHILIFLALFHSSSIALVVLKSNFFTEHRTTTHYVSPSHRFHHLVVVICTSTTTSTQMLTKTSDALPIPRRSIINNNSKTTLSSSQKFPLLLLQVNLHTYIQSYLHTNNTTPPPPAHAHQIIPHKQPPSNHPHSKNQYKILHPVVKPRHWKPVELCLEPL